MGGQFWFGFWWCEFFEDGEEEGGWDWDNDGSGEPRYEYEDGALRDDMPYPLPLPLPSESTLTELLLFPPPTYATAGTPPLTLGGSYPGCLTPKIQIGSIHLSGCASLSNKYLTALSR